ncbi:MAG: protein-glutamate O-methyltransferase CheR [Gammaproteobacteria bacterium]|nr:protein-glutamate O-methyltransferase CheR [Gammaproteobacteria bacterium]
MLALSAKSVSEADVIVGILALMHERTGYDFSSYRAQTIRRRIRNRMISVGIHTLTDYLVHLKSVETEASELLDRLTVKVSHFYRNAHTFDMLREEVLPGLYQRFGGPLRIWSAGCARGEEPYTLALLLEAAGIPGTVLATDIDEAALRAARRGIYLRDALRELPRSLIETGLEPVPGDERHVRVRPALRRRVHFQVHDVTGTALPLGTTDFHMISYRNVLIYLQREVQERTLLQMRAVLRDGGCLCLGEAEWPPPSVACSLSPLPQRSRLFEAIAAEPIA